MKHLIPIEMDGFSVLLTRKRIKNINLRIQRTGEVRISVPLKTPLTKVYDFLNEKTPWIQKYRTRLQKIEQGMRQSIESGETIYFKGQPYTLLVHESLIKQGIELTETDLHLFVNPDMTQADKQFLLNEWYHKEIRQLLPSLFEQWEAIIGVKPNKISVKRMKTRWGSCHTTKKYISLNLHLIEKPLICLEYVIVHELVHLLEASHNQRFYAFMDSYMPNWKQIRRRLNHRNRLLNQP